MRIWLDDERTPPGDNWVWVKTSTEAINLLENLTGQFEAISFDHDLGGDDTTRRVMTWLIEHEVWPETVYIHTANGIGRDWLEGTASRYFPEQVAVIAHGRDVREAYRRRYGYS